MRLEDGSFVPVQAEPAEVVARRRGRARLDARRVHVLDAQHDAAKKASPLSYVRKGLPPFLLLFSEREPPTLDEMAHDFAASLLGHGVSAEVRRYEGCTHRTIVQRLHDAKDPVARRVLGFIADRVR